LRTTDTHITERIYTPDCRVHEQHERIGSTATLSDGDHIRIGDHEFTFSAKA